jgi:hypothetical protein
MPKKNSGKKQKSLSWYKQKAWTEFSRMIRLEAVDLKTGLVSCVTCSRKALWNDGMQAGHFIDGRYNSVIFYERGVHVQCYACNIIYNGRKDEYFLYMEKSYGREEIDKQMRMKWENVSFTRDQLEDMRKEFKRRADAAEVRLNQ